MNPPTGLRVGILSRKSAKEAPGNLSQTSQHNRGRKWCAETGNVVVWCDGDNEPASGITREVSLPKRAEILAMQKRGEVDIIWLTRQDRLTREGAPEMLRLIMEGYRFWLNNKGLDTATLPDPRVDMIGCLTVLLEADSDRKVSLAISANVSSAKATMRDVGAWLGKAPYGTAVVGTKLTRRLTNGDYWPHVVRMFKERADNRLSYRKVAELFTADGIPAPTDSGWGEGTVYDMIHHPVYEGWMTVPVKGRRIPYLNAAGERVRTFAEDAEVIPADLAKRARELAPATRIIPVGDRRGHAVHLMTGIARCVGCKSRMPANGNTQLCGRYSNGKHCPEPAMVKRVRLEEYVKDQWLSRMINAKDDDPVILAAWHRWKARTAPEEVEGAREAREALAEAERALQRLMEDKQAGYYAGPVADLFGRLHAEAMDRWKSAKERVDAIAAHTPPVDFAAALIAAYNAPEADQRDLIHLAITNVWVTKASRTGPKWDPESRVRIEWASTE